MRQLTVAVHGELISPVDGHFGDASYVSPYIIAGKPFLGMNFKKLFARSQIILNIPNECNSVRIIVYVSISKNNISTYI